jgi:D-alanyl-D-alanine carboxypeptidase (penicillin-binding protein 5/6)
MKLKKSFIFGIIILILIVAYVIAAISWPFPKIVATSNDITVAQPSVNPIAWPQYGQSAVGAVDSGLLSSNGDQNAKPIASIAKTMLALSIIKEKPLKLGEQGPTYRFTDKDIELYKSNLAQNGSVVPIALNEDLTEYQMLQALLIPSGDNIADTLAIWTFGSIENYLNYANKLANDLGLKQTHMADASGLSPQTVSSASDLIKLGEKIMQEPVLKEIVGQSQVTLPVLETANNYNTLLGTDGIIGIKTGNTDEAGGCLLFAYTKNINGKDTTLIGVILGATDRARVLSDTFNFVETNANAFGFTDVLAKDTIVGKYATPWGKTVNVVPKDNLSILTTKNNQITVSVALDTINKPLNAGSDVGIITVKSGSETYTVPAQLSEDLTKPSVFWKLTHPFK